MVASKAQRAATAERRTKAIALRLAGLDNETIATRLGYAGSAAVSKDISRALDANRAAEREWTDELRVVEALRLDRLQAAVWPSAVSGDPRSIDTALRIMERRARLFGLDAPTRVDSNTTFTTYQVDLGDGDAAKAALT